MVYDQFKHQKKFNITFGSNQPNLFWYKIRYLQGSFIDSKDAGAVEHDVTNLSYLKIIREEADTSFFLVAPDAVSHTEQLVI